MVNARRGFGLAFCLAAALAVGLTAWLARADAPVTTSPTPTGSVAMNPPPGIAGDAVAAPVSLPADPRQAAMVQRGEYLTVAGDCQYCHSIPGGAPYAGGQPVQTPFGDLFTPNITPDKTYGIGNWSDAQFWNALHNGIGPGHSLLVFPHYLYPVMPWQDYNRLSYPDVMAIKAYLMSIAPVAAPDRPSQMQFPFTIRAGLLAWRILFFHNQPIHDDPSWTPQVRNGAYLVLALAHCSECHTQRNLLMAVEPSRFLGGGHLLAQSWYAPDISSGPDGVGGWSQADLTNYLWRDGGMGTGGPYGPMKAVVEDSLSRLPQSDIQDIAAYLQTATPAKAAEVTPPPAAPPAGDGARLYADNCARCHGGNGEGVTNNFPNLAGNAGVYGGPADNVISMILGGYIPWHSNQSGMPEFDQSLSDGQIAAIANYVRTAWGNQGVADASATGVAGLRGTASDWVVLDTGSTQATLGTTRFDNISGQLELFGHHQNCMLNATLEQGGGQKVALAGSCAAGGSRLDGTLSLNGQSLPVALHLQLGSGAVRLWGKVPGTDEILQARIALALPAA